MSGPYILLAMFQQMKAIRLLENQFRIFCINLVRKNLLKKYKSRVRSSKTMKHSLWFNILITTNLNLKRRLKKTLKEKNKQEKFSSLFCVEIAL